jgi:asparagine synthase (glutamine-hydrolysing)
VGRTAEPVAAQVPLYGIVARTARGRQNLRARMRTANCNEKAVEAGWWSDSEVGLGMRRPDFTIGTPTSAIALRTDSYATTGVRGSANAERVLRQLRQHEATALTGMAGGFALASWDGRRKRLTLARDPLGQRGLFIRSDEDFHVFSSELETLLIDPIFSCQLDFESAFHYLACGLPAPGRTMARDVRSVPAAHLMWWEPGRQLLSQRYWSPLTDGQPAEPQTSIQVSEAIDKAIESRLERGRSQALLLSGGLDSSFIAATASAAVGGEHLHAYTIEFAAAYKQNETQHAKLVAETFKIPHRVVPLHAAGAVSVLQQVLKAPQPCSAWATLTHHQLLDAIGQDGHRSVLSGLGSDEIFASYERMLEYYFRARNRLESWPAQGQVDAFDAGIWDSNSSRDTLYPGVACFFSDTDLRKSVSAPFHEWHYASHLEEFYRECRIIKPAAQAFEMMVAHECQRRVPDLLFAGFEPISRAKGIRMSYPFLDQAVVQLACALRAKNRYEYSRSSKAWRNKILFRRIAAKRLPASIVRRLPASYSAPFAQWMKDPIFSAPTLARLRESRFWKLGLVRRNVLGGVLKAMSQTPVTTSRKPAPWASHLWILLTLTSWYDRYVEGLS